MSDQIVECHIENEWATLWLNRPDVRNALSSEMVASLRQHLTDLAQRDDVRGLTVRGRGGTFCAGGDIKAFKAIFQGGAQTEEDVAAANREGGELFAQIDAFPHPVIMLVEGAAMAGGMGMVCTGDIVIATTETKFALTETTLGIPPAQIAPYIVRRLGLATARRLMLTAARFTAVEAHGFGLVDYVVPHLEEAEAQEASIRGDVLKCAPGANAITKDIVRASFHLSGETLMNYAARGFAKAMLSDEGREGVSAFLEKRSAAWSRLGDKK